MAPPNRVVGSEVGLWVEKGANGGGPGLTGCPWQEEGELCLNSIQCKSKCCHRDTGLSLARCAPKARESSGCSAFVSSGAGRGGGGEDSSEAEGPRGLGGGVGGIREEAPSGHGMLRR